MTPLPSLPLPHLILISSTICECVCVCVSVCTSMMIGYTFTFCYIRKEKWRPSFHLAGLFLEQINYCHQLVSYCLWLSWRCWTFSNLRYRGSTPVAVQIFFLTSNKIFKVIYRWPSYLSYILLNFLTKFKLLKHFRIYELEKDECWDLNVVGRSTL